MVPLWLIFAPVFQRIFCPFRRAFRPIFGPFRITDDGGASDLEILPTAVVWVSSGGAAITGEAERAEATKSAK